MINDGEQIKNDAKQKEVLFKEALPGVMTVSSAHNAKQFIKIEIEKKLHKNRIMAE